MAFLNDLINKFKGNNQSGGAIVNAINNPQNSSPIMAGIDQYVNAPQNTGGIVPVNSTNPVQSGSVVQNAVNTTVNTPNTSGASKIINVLKGVAPSNWSDDTRQKVLMASQFLSGFGGTQYDPNQSQFGNIARGFSNGSNAAYKQIQNYGNYQQVKNMYDQMGYDTSGLSPLGDYSKVSPSSLLSAGARLKQTQIKQDIANAKDNTSRAKLILDNYNKGIFTAETAQAMLKMYGIDVKDLQQSNQTKVSNARVDKIKADIKQNQQKISILKQKVAQGAATSGDKQLLTQLNIQNKKLLIEQNELINKSMREQLGNGGNGGNAGNEQKGRPIGQKNNSGYSF